MNTLILNGSPRKNGETVTLIKEIQKNLIGNVEVISPFTNNIVQCNDCRYCWENDGCSIDDDMQIIYKRFNTYDNIIFASPLYFSELSVGLLTMASRFEYFFAMKFFREAILKGKKKNGVLILVAGYDDSTEKAESTANIIFKHINTVNIETIASLNTNVLPVASDSRCLNKLKSVAVQLNNLFIENQKI